MLSQKQPVRWIQAGPFLNGWVNFDTARPTGYTKTDEGLVILRGILVSGTVNAPAFYLQPEYRPRRAQVLPAISAVAGQYFPATFLVETDGRVIPSYTIGAGTLLYISLDGLTFATQP